MSDIDIKIARRTALYRELRLILAAALVAVAIGIPSYIAYRQSENSKVTKNSNEILHVVLDCTTPGGTCYKRGQATTAATIGKVQTIIILAAVCAKVPANTTVSQIETCVENGLK